MGYRIKFDAKHRVVLLAFQGVVTDSSIFDALSALSAFITTALPVEGGIVDFSGIQEIRLSRQFVRNFVTSRPPILPEKPRVFVAPRPDIYGLARMFQLHREMTGYVMGVVRTMDDAWRYLQLQSPEFQPVPGPAANSEQPTT
ncbi:MAG TPA: hypothetical protein VK419_17900 [Bryobacteraceae bacterium]|nr:hypothetical protein [Bryobacteraceae bacterium]